MTLQVSDHRNDQIRTDFKVCGSDEWNWSHWRRRWSNKVMAHNRVQHDDDGLKRSMAKSIVENFARQWNVRRWLLKLTSFLVNFKKAEFIACFFLLTWLERSPSENTKQIKWESVQQRLGLHDKRCQGLYRATFSNSYRTIDANLKQH